MLFNNVANAQETPLQEPLPNGNNRSMPRSVSGIREMANTIRENARKKATETGVDNETLEKIDKKAGKIYRALQYRLQMRAYPHDSINEAVNTHALERVKRMPKATFLKRSNGTNPVTVPKPDGNVRLSSGGGGNGTNVGDWYFIGPKLLATPYQIYYGPPGSYTSGRVNGVAYDPVNPGTIYLSGAQGGIWKSTDGGQTWICVSNANNWPYPQHVTAVAVHPTNGTIYAGTGDFNTGEGAGTAGGLIVSSNGGETWSRLPSNPTEQAKLAGQTVSTIIIDPVNPNLITIATGRGPGGGGIWRSTDGGQTWNRANGTGNAAWSGLERCVPGGVLGAVYVACAIGNGIYFSLDQGANWQRIANAPLAFNNPASPSGGIGLRIGASKSIPGVVYVIDASAAALDGRIFRGTLTPSGQWNWSDITSGFPIAAGGFNTFAQASYDLHITTTRQFINGAPGDTVYAGTINLNAAALGGTDWTDISFTLTPQALMHNDQHSFAENPHQIYKAMAGNDGGIYGVNFNPNTGTWVFDDRLSATLGITQFYKADWDASDYTVMLGGTQDNATPQASGTLDRWNNVGGGDGGGCAINLVNPNLQYTTSQNGVIYRTTNRWSSTGLIALDFFWGDTNIVSLESEAPFVGVVETSKSLARPNFLYYGTQYVWRWSETTGWLVNDNDPPLIKPMGDEQLADDGAFVSAIASARRGMFEADGRVLEVPIGELSYPVTEGNVVYAGSSDGQLWMTRNALDTDADTDHEITWISLNVPTLPTGAITSIKVNPNNAADILVTVNNGATGGTVLRCTNTNSPAPVFTPRNGFGDARLPGAFINDISIAPDDPNTWYVASDIGVFITTDAGGNWADATLPLGLPQVECTAIEAMPVRTDGTSAINVATYGRGMWRLDLVAPAPVNIDYGGSLRTAGTNTQLVGSIVNRGRQLNGLAILSATMQIDRRPTVNAVEIFPVNLGSLVQGGVVPRTFNFPTGAVRRGSAVTYTITFTYDGAPQPFVVSKRTRIP
jgi:photosystem II stability/assembly factor-like uncharacterized protein